MNSSIYGSGLVVLECLVFRFCFRDCSIQGLAGGLNYISRFNFLGWIEVLF